MEKRKKHHIDLAFESQTSGSEKDPRFSYEPLLSAHPELTNKEFTFLGKSFNMPFWVSSMTGGTEMAGKINHNLAKACGEFGFGMGLGSCRIILDDNKYFSDFDVRDLIGEKYALFANLGISQIEQHIGKNSLTKIHDLVNRLRADGLIIHVNPIQEWVQPEGDILSDPPIDTIKRFIEKANYRVIVKEVGQGMGPESLRALLKLPIEAIEFAAFGGTNFAKVELYRRPDHEKDFFAPFARIGEDAESMVNAVNAIINDEKDYACRQLIISGGVKNYLDGYYLLERSKLSAIYGQASAFLRYAKEGYDELAAFIETQIRGLRMAQAYLRVKE